MLRIVANRPVAADRVPIPVRSGGQQWLGFTRGQCLTGPGRGTVLVRSVWRAEVELHPWEARFEIADRRVVAPAAAEEALSLGSHPFAAIIRRELAEAALTR